MKKILLAWLIGALALAGAEELNLGDKNLVEEFGMRLVKASLDQYDPDSLGLWVLREEYRSKYQRVRNDEFELSDAKQWALNQFKKKLSSVPPLDKNARYHIYLKVKFGKYDFSKQAFPIEGISKGTHLQYRGKGYIVSGGYGYSKLAFDNPEEGANYLPMSKEAAKAFIRSRKSSGGYVNRSLVAHYIYVMTDYKTIDEFRPLSRTMKIQFTGKLLSVEYMDKERRKIFHSYAYGKTQKNTGNPQTDSPTLKTVPVQ